MGRGVKEGVRQCKQHSRAVSVLSAYCLLFHIPPPVPLEKRRCLVLQLVSDQLLQYKGRPRLMRGCKKVRDDREPTAPCRLMQHNKPTKKELQSEEGSGAWGQLRVEGEKGRVGPVSTRSRSDVAGRITAASISRAR